MFAKFFSKTSPSDQHPQHQQNAGQGSLTSTDVEPLVVAHYGVPSTASILAFDHIQRLLAIGTLDGRIKVIGGDNIEGILFSPNNSPFKNLEFLQNQGFLVSISNNNEIQVWDLESRQIASALQWESTITAFSVIYGTSCMYIGSEHGTVSVLKFNSEDRKIKILPYYVPTNVLAEAVEMPLDHVSVVKVLHQPCSHGNRLLIAYENGVLVLWDASEDRIVLIRGHKDLQLKGKKVTIHPNNAKELSDDKPDNLEDKEISSLCWASKDGSVIAVGYVDGDIMFWDLSTAGSTIDQKAEKPSNYVVKLQLSSAERRLPIIVLHWCANRSHKNNGGQLFVYGGDEIGSEEVLSVLSLDWSSGIESLECTGQIDIALCGSFADMVLLASDHPTERDCDAMYVLTNPGLLHLYDNACLSSLLSQQERKASVPAVQHPMVIPTLEPDMTTATLGVVYRDVKSFGALSEIVLAARQHATHNQTSTGVKRPLTGGVPVQPFKEDQHVYQIYIAGYKDGSVLIWDATNPAFSPLYSIKSKASGVQINGASAPISALDLFPDTLQLAVGNECGVVRLYQLTRSSDETPVHFVTENGTEVRNMHQGEGPHCTAVFSLLGSAVCTLKFSDNGGKLAVGYECGRVAMLNASTYSVLFLTNTESETSSPVISLNMKFSDTSCLTNVPQESLSDINDSPEKGLLFIMKSDACVVVDTVSGNTICSMSLNPKNKSNAISMHIIDGTSEPSSERLPSNSPQHCDSRNELAPANIQSESTPVEVETTTTVENSEFAEKLLNSFLLLCYESELSLHTIKSVIEGCSKYIRKVNLAKQCCWTTTLKKDEKECGLVVLYQTGEIEIRSLPTLEVVGESSLLSILRWNFKTNMVKPLCSCSSGQINLVNGNETAFISLLACENRNRVPEFLPCLYDKALAAAVDATANLSPNQTDKQGVPARANFLDFVKNFKLGKAEQNAIQAVNLCNLEDLERLFSSPPFLKPSKEQDAVELNIDEIQIDEPVAPLSSQKIYVEKKDKEKETDREKLLEGASTDTKPRVRTAEEIKAKYRKAGVGDASAAAELARDKLAERGEKLQKLSEHTAELQNGAEDFASMAKELAKRMENRKWWQI